MHGKVFIAKHGPRYCLPGDTSGDLPQLHRAGQAGWYKTKKGIVRPPPPLFSPLFGRHPNIGLFSALADKSFCLVYFLNPKPGWNEGDRQGAPVWGRKAVAAREEERNFRSARTLKKWGWQEQNSWTSPYYYASVRGRPHVLNSALCFVCSLVVCNVKAPESQLRKVLFHRICTVFCFSLLLLPVKRLKCEASFLTQRMQCYRKPGFDVGSFYSIETLWSFSRHPGKANSQLWVGSRLPANRNSEHHVLLPGATCLPKFLASKHRHVEFVMVVIYFSAANCSAVAFLVSRLLLIAWRHVEQTQWKVATELHIHSTSLLFNVY